MDISETYIKMCEKAEEIQEIYRKDLTVRCTPSNAGYLIDSKYDYLYRHKLGGTPIWLPRQDQLQEMMKCIELPILCSVFEMFVSNRYEGTQSTTAFIFTSMEQLWLAFVMKEKYNKTWDGENWIIVR